MPTIQTRDGFVLNIEKIISVEPVPKGSDKWRHGYRARIHLTGQPAGLHVAETPTEIHQLLRDAAAPVATGAAPLRL